MAFNIVTPDRRVPFKDIGVLECFKACDAPVKNSQIYMKIPFFKYDADFTTTRGDKIVCINALELHGPEFPTLVRYTDFDDETLVIPLKSKIEVEE